MNKLMHDFLSRLTDRLVVMLGSVVGSTWETFRAQHQAEQQSLLEKLAREYETDGQPEVAQVLRERARNLAAENPAFDAEAIFSNTRTTQVDASVISSLDASSSDKTSFRRLPSSTRKNRRRKQDPKGTNTSIEPSEQ